jgi:phosphatidate cytidylyltransferase
MTNTQLRVVSAFVLLCLVLACLWFGLYFTLGFIGVASVLVIDEIAVNFFKITRWRMKYFSAQILFVGLYIFFNIFEVAPGYFSIFLNAALLMNLGLILFLFYPGKKIGEFLIFVRRVPVLIGMFVLLPIMCMTSLIHQPMWQGLMAVLLLVNFGMDTGAWFFGRKFGRHKLWPAVSPNKTIEGLLGGVFVSATIGSLTWWLIMNEFTWVLVVTFALLGVISQVGDLVQSKLKRHFAIKDSSSLIPGHGGVYDRLDSLLFLAPFYVWALSSL